MFNDEFGLTQSVLDGNKKQTRRICKYDRPSDEWEIGFPIFEANDFNDEGECTSPLNYAFGWRNKSTGEEIKWNIPKYKVGEVIAIAQNYKSIIGFKPTHSLFSEKGYKNKMFVRADLMPHQIKVTKIRIQKLQDISDEDCLKEGIIKREEVGYIVNGLDRLMPHGNAIAQQVSYYYESIVFDSPREAFAALINKASGRGTWESNPYVFVYEFELIK